MEIKTLAQILAENQGDVSQNQPKTTQRKPKGDSLTKRAFEKRVHSTSNQEKYRRPTHTSTKSSKPKIHHIESDKDYIQDSFTGSVNDKTITRTHTKNRKKKEKAFHPASPYQPQPTHTALNQTAPTKEVDGNRIRHILAEVTATSNNKQVNLTECDKHKDRVCTPINAEDTNSSTIDNIPVALKAYLKTPEQRHAEKEKVKATSRLRWLAFYYLSRREHSKDELRQKLIDKEQDPQKVDELLEEFGKKGYQSDYRTALMLIREGIRKRRGRIRIKNDFYKLKVALPSNIDELIDLAMDDSEAFSDTISKNDLVEGVDWLQLAVEARVKKYGSAIPTHPKEKAKQLRFLQYRGFQSDICFSAITHDLATLDDRF